MLCGSTSRTRERQFIIDKTAPAVPTITVNGTHGPNSTDTTYVGRIIVSIKPTDKDANGNKDTSGIWGIKYQVVGDNPIKETRVAGTGTYNITITRVGISTVLAYTIDNATNQSEQISQEVERVAQAGDDDVGEPGITLTPTLTTENSAVVTVKVTGETAEIEKYRFDYKLDTDTTWQTASTRVSNYRTYGFTYNDLTSGQTYNLRVTATDTEGEIYSSDVQNVTVNYIEYQEVTYPTDTTLMGKSIDYVPENKTITIPTSLTGSSVQQTLTTEELGWQIWGSDKDSLYLIPYTSTKSEINGKGKTCVENIRMMLACATLGCYGNAQYPGLGSGILGNDGEAVRAKLGLTMYDFPNRDERLYAGTVDVDNSYEGHVMAYTYSLGVKPAWSLIWQNGPGYYKRQTSEISTNRNAHANNNNP